MAFSHWFVRTSFTKSVMSHVLDLCYKYFLPVFASSPSQRCLFFFFDALWAMWGLSSPIRGWTCTSFRESMDFLTTGPPGKPSVVSFDVTSPFAFFLVCLPVPATLAKRLLLPSVIWPPGLCAPLPSLQNVPLPDTGNHSVLYFTWVSAQMASSQGSFPNHCIKNSFPPSLLPCLIFLIASTT